MKYLLAYIIVLFTYDGQAQQLNAVNIDSTDGYPDIIRKAANIVPSARQLRWQELELVAFFHFGINTFTDREWGDGKEDPRGFNPSALDAAQWVSTVKKAGMKQVILTAKHHDGFCLWPTSTTLHSVKSSPWKNGKGDVVKEVATACKKQKIGFGIYLSPWDRNNPLYGSEAYNDLFVAQLTELLSNYGRIDEVWFDGANGEGPSGKKQVYDFARWYALIRKLQPGAVIAVMGPDVRWVGTETGYGRATEWSVVPVDYINNAAIAANSQQAVAFRPEGNMMGEVLGSREQILQAKGLAWYPAETDVSIRPGWFYHEAENQKVKSGRELLEIYFNSVGRNSLLLLNIPPDKRGLISDADIKALEDWKNKRDQVFANNLCKGAKIKAGNGANEKKLLDGNYKTHCLLPAGDSTAVIAIQLKKKSSFNLLMLQENIAKGQRVENFQLEYLSQNGWKLISRGTTIGYKRMLGFETISTDQLRLKITSSRGIPYISELGLYLQPYIDKPF
jgi:alpha-L-fucosidase